MVWPCKRLKEASYGAFLRRFSLLAAMLGEMVGVSGKVKTAGSLSYVAQQAWIQNSTLRDNILFCKDFEEKKYEDIIESCALKTDLEILPAAPGSYRNALDSC